MFWIYNMVNNLETGKSFFSNSFSLFYLSLGLPVEVRDKALQLKSSAPSTDINRQYFAQNLANKVKERKIERERKCPLYKKNEFHT